MRSRRRKLQLERSGMTSPQPPSPSRLRQPLSTVNVAPNSAAAPDPPASDAGSSGIEFSCRDNVDRLLGEMMRGKNKMYYKFFRGKTGGCLGTYRSVSSLTLLNWTMAEVVSSTRTSCSPPLSAPQLGVAPSSPSCPVEAGCRRIFWWWRRWLDWLLLQGHQAVRWHSKFPYINSERTSKERRWFEAKSAKGVDTTRMNDRVGRRSTWRQSFKG